MDKETKSLAGESNGFDWVFVLFLVFAFSNPYFKSQETEELKLKVAKLEAKEELLEKIVIK